MSEYKVNIDWNGFYPLNINEFSEGIISKACFKESPLYGIGAKGDCRVSFKKHEIAFGVESLSLIGSGNVYLIRGIFLNEKVKGLTYGSCWLYDEIMLNYGQECDRSPVAYKIFLMNIFRIRDSFVSYTNKMDGKIIISDQQDVTIDLDAVTEDGERSIWLKKDQS